MRRLMIIDDEFIFRQGLKYMMDWEANNYTIAGEASNGKEGLELFLKLQPDIVLCDVVMPGISGIQFVAMLRRYSKAPIVMLSNFNEFDKVREAFQYGASDYLLKNRVTKDSLLECLNRLGLGSKQLYDRRRGFERKRRSGTFSETPARYRTLRRCHAGNQRHPVCRNAPPLFQSPDCNAQ